MRYAPQKPGSGSAAAREMLHLPEPLDALFTGNSLLAEGALHVIRAHGLIFPDQIALVTFDDPPWASLVQPAMTLIAQSTYEIGQAAAELLQGVADLKRATCQVIQKGQLVVCGSSAPRQPGP